MVSRSLRAQSNSSHREDAETFIASTVVNPGRQWNSAQAEPNLVTGAMVRRLTPMERERLMALPDGWSSLDADGKPISDSARYRMIGNALVVKVAEWIARRIKSYS